MDLPTHRRSVIVVLMLCDENPEHWKREHRHTVDYSQSQDASRARASYPVEELSGGSARLFLQSDQHLDQHQAFNTATIKTQHASITCVMTMTKFNPNPISQRKVHCTQQYLSDFLSFWKLYRFFYCS